MKQSSIKYIMLPVLISALLTASIAFSQATYPMIITQTRTMDESGNTKSTFKRGDLVLVEATVNCPFQFYAPPEYRFLFIVKFVDSNGVTFYYGVVYGSLQPGKNATFAVGGKIPEGAPVGTYRAHIYVWSNWPAYAWPTAYAQDVEVTFTVQA